MVEKLRNFYYEDCSRWRGFDKELYGFESLTKQWHKYLKKEYWPDIDGRDEIEDISIRLTDHKKKNYYNIAPAISPDGSDSYP